MIGFLNVVDPIPAQLHYVPSASSAAESYGRQVGNTLGLSVSVTETMVGTGMMAGGGGLEFATAGLATPVAVPAALVGAASTAHGLVGINNFIYNSKSTGPGTATAPSQAAPEGAAAQPKGGAYVLRDAESGQVMRTGRTRDLGRRGAEHGRDPNLRDLEFEPVHRTDVYNEQRGLEQMLHDKYQPPLNKIRPISPTNPKLPMYQDAAKTFLEQP